MSNMSISKGVGPHSKPYPTGEEFDVQLLMKGDSRNVIDEYRYKTIEHIQDDMRSRSGGLEIAIENYSRDFNMGTILRNANAFNARRVYIIGSKQWNKRGAMMTDKYLEIIYYKDIKHFLSGVGDKQIICIDNKQGAEKLSSCKLAKDAIYVFGNESDGVSPEMIEASSQMIAIEQFGSTRSINVGVASGILMYEWTRQNLL